MNKSQSESKKIGINHQIYLQQSKTIRSMHLLNQGKQVAIMAYLQVIIVDIEDSYPIKTIKRVSPPKQITIIPNQKYMVIHYSDNYCILYDTYSFQEVYIIVGVPSDHKGIKPSDDGRFLLYGNNGGALQVWNVLTASIQLLSHKLKYFSTYDINFNGSQVYLGTFNGQIIFVSLKSVKQQRSNRYFKVPFSHEIKLHQKCVMAIQHINPSSIISIDYGLQVAVVSTSSSHIVNILCKIQLTAPITKNLIFLYSQKKDSIYLNVNDLYYRIGGCAAQDKENRRKCTVELMATKCKQNLFSVYCRREVIICGLREKNVAELNYC